MTWILLIKILDTYCSLMCLTQGHRIHLKRWGRHPGGTERYTSLKYCPRKPRQSHFLLIGTSSPLHNQKKKKKVQFKTWEAQNHYTKLTPWAVLHTQIGWGAASGPEKWMKPGSWMVLVLQVNRTLPDSSNRRFLSNCQFCWQGIACSYLKRSIQQNKIE